MTQKTILCYGDSNTWGYVPNSQPSLNNASRYSRKERWTGLLQEKLGENYYVIEEGLNGRTTNVDYFIPPDRNGKTYLAPCLYSQAPIDLIILALGGNDLKAYFNRSPEMIRDGLAELIDMIQASQYGESLLQAPRVLILSVPLVLPITERFIDERGIIVFEGARKKAEQLIDLYAELADQKKCYFLDISRDVLPSEIDGGHFDAKAHRVLAAMLVDKLNSIFL